MVTVKPQNHSIPPHNRTLSFSKNVRPIVA